MRSAGTSHLEGRYRQMLESIPHLFWTCTPDGHCDYLSPQWVNFTGVPDADQLGTRWLEQVHPDDRDQFLNKWIIAPSKGEPFITEFRLRRADGVYRWFRMRAIPLHDADGKLEKWFGSNSDIHDLVEAGEELKKTEALLRAVTDSTTDFIFAKDLEGRIILANTAMVRASGMKASDILGKTDAEYLPADDAALLAANDRRIMKTGVTEVVEESLTTPDGVTHVLVSTKSPMRGPDGDIIGLVGITKDMSSQKEVEMALRESEARFRQLADAVPQIVWVALPDGVQEYYNRRWYEFTGMPPGSTGGEGWTATIHPDDQDRAWAAWHHSLDTGEPYEIEHRLRHYSGEYRWVLGRALPIRNNTGEIVKWYGTCTDIHDQKAASEILEHTVAERTAALAETTRNLKRSNRELDQFAYAASHDMQEPLRKIRVFADRLQEKHGAVLNEDAQMYIDKIVASAERMSGMISDLLEFSRLSEKAGNARRELTDLGTVAQDVLGDFELLIQQKKAEVEIGELPSIEAVPLQMTQLFYNLLSNALKFTRTGEAPKISVQSRLLDDAPTRYEITVSDNGIGFEQQYAERIFEVFNRLNGRSEFEGSGIGLALCKRIVEAHGGTIYAESEEGVGTVFKVVLPAKAAVENPPGLSAAAS
jgi:PAS domain S-box-containing protein